MSRHSSPSEYVHNFEYGMHSYRSTKNENCSIYYEIEMPHTINISTFQCFQPTIETDIIPKAKGEGRKMMYQLLRYVKHAHPYITTISLMAFPYSYDVMNQNYIDNIKKHQKKIENYYVSLGFTRSETEDGDVIMTGNIDHLLNTIKNYRAGGRQTKRGRTKKGQTKRNKINMR